MQRRTYLSSEEIYHLLKEDTEKWSADGSKSSDDGEGDHVSKNALSDSSEEERSTFRLLDCQILSFREMEVKVVLVIL